MALSKDEQRILAEIERALSDEDPRFVNAVNLDQHRRHWATISGLLFILGMTLLVAGEVSTQDHLTVGVLVSLVGFLTMLAATALIFGRRHHTPFGRQ